MPKKPYQPCWIHSLAANDDNYVQLLRRKNQEFWPVSARPTPGTAAMAQGMAMKVYLDDTISGRQGPVLELS